MTEIQRKKRSLTEQGAWILGARAIGFSFNILLPLLLIRRLDQTQFGLYKQAFLIIITASQVLAFGFGMSAYYFLPRETDRKPQIIFNILLYNLFVGTLACLALVLAPEILGAIFHSDEMTRHAPLIGVAVLFWIFSTFLENAAVANQESHLATFFIIGSQITKTALLLGAAVFFGTVDSLIIAFLIQTGLQAVVMLFYLNSRFPGFWFAFNPRTFWQQAVYAVPLGAAGLLWAMQTDLHNYFVSHKFTPAEFAIYAVGCFELPLIGMLSEAVTSVLIPRMSELESKNDKTEILNLTIKAMERLAFAYFPIYVLFMIVAESFIATLFTENYLASVPIFRVNITLLPFYVVALDAVVRAFKQLGRVLLVFRIFLFECLLRRSGSASIISV